MTAGSFRSGVIAALAAYALHIAPDAACDLTVAALDSRAYALVCG